MKQDMNGVRTAQDLELKYNLSAIEEIKKETQKNTQQINSTNNELKDFTTQVTKDLGELQDQIDGNIMTWFLSGVPTLSNPPANEWTTDEEKNNHLGDLYYDKDTGYAYRFTLENGVYNWLKLTDSDIAEALAVANSAQDTADSKRGVFLEQPIPPYDSGDMWIKDKEIYICQVSKAKGESYEEKDFINNLKYTDDTYAIQVGNNLKVVSGTVLEIQNDVDEYSRTLTETQTLVNEQGEEIGILNEKYTKVEQTTNGLAIEINNNYHEITEKIDEQGQTIQTVVESNQEVVDKTFQLTMEVDQLKGQISEVADVTTTADGYGSISADNINVSEPILLRIRPVGEDFACIYPRTNLYPSSTLYPKNRKITFENTTTNEKIEYLIPKDLWYFDSNNYDEFVLDYENAQCYILHKVGVNADGTKYILEMPNTEYFDYPTISLTEGDYNIYTNSFNTAYIYVRLMTSNIYTSQFATKVELNSSITQTAKEINLEVSKKVDESEVISKINLSPETILIDTNKLNVNAIATFTNNKLATAGSTTINGSNITTGTIDASKVDVTNLTADNITGGNINGNNVTITNLDASNITSGTLNGNEVDVTNLNASNITGGTLSADKISGGTIKASTISLKNVTLGTSTSKISGWNLGTSAIYSTNANVDSYIYSNGDVMFGGNHGMIKFDTDPVRITTAYKMLISDRYSASAIYNPNDTINIRCYNGTLHLNSSYGVYANDTLLASSSSKNVKKNIKRLSKRKIEELYENVKNLPSYEYNYKKKYCGGQKNNYGFIIEDFENSILAKILHVTQNQEDKNIKSYSHEDLTRVNTILIQELMKKIDKLEKENIELRRKINAKN